MRALTEPFLIFLNELVATLVSHLIKIPLHLDQIAVVEGESIAFKYFVTHHAHFVEVGKDSDIKNETHHLRKYYDVEGVRVMQEFEEILRKRTV